LSFRAGFRFYLTLTPRVLYLPGDDPEVITIQGSLDRFAGALQ
jgi:hypothetical protein